MVNNDEIHVLSVIECNDPVQWGTKTGGITMKKYALILMILALPMMIFAAETIKQTDEYYSTLKVGMYTVTRSVMDQANVNSTSTVRTEITEANATAVTTKMTTQSTTIMKMKGVSIPPQESTSMIETTYLMGKGILKIKGYSIISGKKYPIPEKTTNISENGAIGKVPVQAEVKPYDQKMSTKAGSFTCALYESAGAKTWISKDVPLGGLVKMKTPQLTMELIEFGHSASAAPAQTPVEKEGGHCGACGHH